MSRQYTNLPQPPPRPIPANRNEPKNSIWTTSGRIGRKDYRISILIGCGMLILAGVMVWLGKNPPNLFAALPFGLIFFIWSIVLIIFTVKRLHDMYYSGYWWFLILFINFTTFGYASIIIIILLCCIPGTKYASTYGDVPLKSIFSKNIFQ